MAYAYEVEAGGTFPHRRIVIATSAEIAARKFHRAVWREERSQPYDQQVFTKGDLVPVSIKQLSQKPVVG
jgi:acyl transferase domain-containing protein